MDNIKVAIRVRPIIAREQKLGCKDFWVLRDNTMAPMENGRVGTPYSFDRIFGQDKTTLDIFEEICKPVITGAVQGFHGTIFAYGQSSSGKTFTMSGSAEQPGIISLSVEEIFRQMKNTPDKEFLLRISYMEIYNEKVSDLLSTEDKPIRIQEDTDRNIQLTGVSEELVMSAPDVKHYMAIGNERKHMAETKQNDRSSRSHCIMRMIIESREMGDEDAVMVSHLNFVDLAGSEKAHENSGDRYKEGCAINKSLFMLGTVISKLSDGVGHQHIGYRDSKLTRILQNALGGNSKTAIIATITPASVEESHSTLRFASRAKTIKNAPHVNESLSDAAMLKRSRKEIQILQKQIEELKGMDRGGAFYDPDVLLEKEEMQKKLEEKMEQERKHMETIDKLKQFIIKASSENEGESNFKKLKRRRETWCPGKAKGPSELPGASKFARDLSGQRMDIDFDRRPCPKSFVTSRRDETDISEMQSLADISLPGNDSLFSEFPPKMDDFPIKEKRHVSFKSPEFDSPPFHDRKEIIRLQDEYENLLQLYEQKCKQSEQDHSYIIHELDCVKEELEKEKKCPSNAQVVEELKIDLKKVQIEKNDLVDEVVLLQHRLAIQTRKVEECMHELSTLRAAPKEESDSKSNADLEGEIERLTTEKEKLASELSDLKNVNEELQHQHETSLEMYIMKIQELEEKIEDNDEILNSQKDKITSLEDESRAMQTIIKDTEVKLSEGEIARATLQTEIDNLVSTQQEAMSTDEGTKQLTIELESSKELIVQKEDRIGALEKEILQLYTKLKEQSGAEGSRKSTADELSDILKEHCEDLENRLKEMEVENIELKSKLEKALTLVQSVQGPRKSAADELSDILKEHCTDLENRLKEMETENNELKKEITSLKSGDGTNENADTCETLLEHCTDLETRLKDVESENMKLKEKIESSCLKENSEANSDVFDNDVEVLRNKCIDLENKLKEVEIKNLDRMDDNSEKEELESLKENIVRLQAENDELKRRAAEGGNQSFKVREPDHLASPSENERTEERNNLDEKVKQLTLENEMLRNKVDGSEPETNAIETLESENICIKKELADMQEANRIAQAKIEHLQHQIVSLGEKFRQSSISESNRKSVESELTDVYKEHCKDLETRVEELQSENSVLSEDMEKLRNKARECEKLEQTIALMELENEKKVDQKELKEDSVQTVGSAQDEKDDLYNRIKDLENEIQQLKTGNDKILQNDNSGKGDNGEEVEKAEDKDSSLSQDLEADIKSKTDNTEEKCNEKDQEIEEMKEKYETLDKKVQDLEKERNDLTKKFSDLLNEKTGSSDAFTKYHELEKQIEMLEDENNVLLEKLHGNSTSEVESLENNIKLLIEENKETLEKLEEKEKLCQKLEDKINFLEEEIKCVTDQSNGKSLTTIEGLQCKIEVLEEENKSLMEKLEKTPSDIDDIEGSQKYDELKHEMETLNEKYLLANEKNTLHLEECETNIDILKGEMEGMSTEHNLKVQEIETQIQSLQEENQNLIDTHNLTVEDLKNKIEKLEAENARLLKELETTTPAGHDIEDQNTEINNSDNKNCESGSLQVELRVKAVEEENIDLLEKIKYSADIIEDLQCKIQSLEEENKNLIERLEESSESSKLEEQECKIEVLEEENKAFMDKFEEKEAKTLELECKIEILEEENKGLMEKCDEVTAVRSDLEEKIRHLEEQNQCLIEKDTADRSFLSQELHCQVEALETEKKDLVEKLEELGNEKDRIIELECKIEILEEERDSLIQRLDENDNSGSTDELNDLKMKNQELSDTIEKGKLKLKELFTKIETLQEENNNLTQKLQETDESLSKLSENESANVELNSQIDALLETVKSLESEKSEMIEKNTALSERVALFESKIEELEDAIKAHRQEITSLHSKLEESECKVEVLQEDNDNLYKKVDSMVEQSELEALRVEKDSLCKKMDSMVEKEQLDELECKAEVLQDENQKLRDQLQHLEERERISRSQENRLGDISNEADILRGEKDKLISELEEVKQDLMKMTKLKDKGLKKIDDLKDDIEIIKATEQVLKNDNEILIQEITALRSKYQELLDTENEKKKELLTEIESLKNKMNDNDDLKEKLSKNEEVWKEKLQKKQDIVDKLMKLQSEAKVEQGKVYEQLRQVNAEKLETMEKLQTSEKETFQLQGQLKNLQKEHEELQAKLKSTENATNLNESTNRSINMDANVKERMIKLHTENSKLRERTNKDARLIEVQQNSIQRLEEELEKKDRSNDLYEKLKTAEEELKKAEQDADKYYDLYQEEEKKVSKIREDLNQRNTEIKKLKEDMASQGIVRSDDKPQEDIKMLKKKFNEVYNELQEAKRQLITSEKEVGDKKLRIILLESTVKEQEENSAKKIKAYEESYEILEERIRDLKNKIRDLENQKSMDDTVTNFNSSMKKSSDLPIGSASSAGGAVDHFNNILLQEENRKLLQKVTRYEKKVEKLMAELMKHNKERQENQELEKKVAELREEEKMLKSQIEEHKAARAPLESVNSVFKMNPKYASLPSEEKPASTAQKHKRTKEMEEGCAQQ